MLTVPYTVRRKGFHYISVTEHSPYSHNIDLIKKNENIICPAHPLPTSIADSLMYMTTFFFKSNDNDMNFCIVGEWSRIFACAHLVTLRCRHIKSYL
jgi:hypothetical protein